MASAHFVDDVVRTGGLGAEPNFFKKLAFRINRGDAEVRTAEIDANREVGHDDLE